jgi:hypothetical protein
MKRTQNKKMRTQFQTKWGQNEKNCEVKNWGHHFTDLFVWKRDSVVSFDLSLLSSFGE